MKKVVKVIHDWIKRITVPQSTMSNFPICPFAKKAKSQKKYKIFVSNENFKQFVLDTIKLWDEYYDIFIIVDESKSINEVDIQVFCDELNETITKNNLYALADHPNMHGQIQNIQTGNLVYPIVLLQNFQKLKEANTMLEKTDYYSYWDKDYYDFIVAKRNRYSNK